jgi:O-antigen/teichoic acid export membrane protein
VDLTGKQILRHASVFGIGAILTRIASIVLLPIYTRYLSPEDYGLIALVDLTVNLLGIAAGGGIVAAATREHFEADDPRHQDRVWWTALAIVATSASVVFGLALLAKDAVAAVVFGAAVEHGDYYLALGLVTLWLILMTSVFEAYFRAEKASTFLLFVSIGRMVINLPLNVLLLVYFGLGMQSVLIGNLIASAVAFLVLFGVFIRQRPHVMVDRALVRPYWRFGWPLIVYGMLSALMHEADRYVLRAFGTLHEVGLYSLAYSIGQGVVALFSGPISSIWGVLVYEVAKGEASEATYVRVFKYYTFGLSLVVLAISLFADIILGLIAPPEYAVAARVVPIIGLAYLLFSVHEQFKVPALLGGQTVAFLPVVGLAAATNILATVAFVPVWGAFGAAWASVVTFLTFSGYGLIRYRRIACYEYPFGRCAAVLGGMAATYLAFQMFSAATPGIWIDVAVGVAIWLVWAAALFGRVLAESLRDSTVFGTPYVRPISR